MSTPTVHEPAARRRGTRFVPLVALLSAVAGCASDLETDYGTIRGDSINGISAFVRLLRDSGHATVARRRLPAAIGDDVRTLVLLDDSFSGLSEGAKRAIDRWLGGQGPRTLLLLLRDGDAAPDYLRAILARGALEGGARDEARARLDDAVRTLESATAVPRAATPPYPDGLEPALRGAGSEAFPVRIGPREEAPPIAARYERHRRLADPRGCETLWEADGEPLLVRTRVADGDVLVLATALPLLNGSLVDPGNRRLAERLADILPGDGDLLVVGSAEVSSAGEEDDDERSPWQILTVRPLPWVVLQAIAALGMFCWCTAPIHGRPRRVRADHAQDFGHHVEALAALLARVPAEGAAFALGRVEEWLRPPRAGSPPARRRRTL